jgi:hypothetical protein
MVKTNEKYLLYGLTAILLARRILHSHKHHCTEGTPHYRKPKTGYMYANVTIFYSTNHAKCFSILGNLQRINVNSKHTDDMYDIITFI